MRTCSGSFIQITCSLLLTFLPSQVESLGRDSKEELRNTIYSLLGTGGPWLQLSEEEGVCRCPGCCDLAHAWPERGSSRVHFCLKSYKT